MGRRVAHKLIEAHLLGGEMTPGREIALRIDQTLTEDATGTVVMLEFERLGLDRVRTELSAQYVDHNLLQGDFRNADDHLFLRSACLEVGHLVLQGRQRRLAPGAHAALRRAGQDAAGLGLAHLCGQLARHAGDRTGGLDVAMSMAGEPYYVTMPQVRGVRLVGELPAWVSAKDVILEMLRRHDVDGGRYRQHGRRAGRDDGGLLIRRRGPPLPGLGGARGRLGADPRRRRR
jgi:aconitate hydratase